MGIRIFISMVNQSQLETVRELVRTSGNLTDGERQEWLSLLSFMNDKQLSELATVLQSGADGADAPKSSVPVKVISALSAPAPELDLPAPSAPKMAPAQTPITAALQPNANTVSAFIDRNFAAALHRTPLPAVPTPVDQHAVPASAVLPVPPPAKVSPVSDIAQKIEVKNNIPEAPEAVAPTISLPLRTQVTPVAVPITAQESIIHDSVSTPEPVIPPISSAMHPSEESVPVESAEEVVAPPKSLEEVRKLNVATLRGRGVINIEKELKNLCQKFGYFSVQFALEHSPLYQTYLAVGSRVLQQHQSFEGVQAELSASNRPYLTKPEFEEINDLLQRIKNA